MIARRDGCQQVPRCPYRLVRAVPPGVIKCRATRNWQAEVIPLSSRFQHAQPGPVALKKKRAAVGSMMARASTPSRRALSRGEEPTGSSVWNTARRRPALQGVEETINFQMRFPSGVLANLRVDYGTNLNSFRVHAENGSFEMGRRTTAARSGCGVQWQRHRTAQPCASPILSPH